MITLLTHPCPSRRASEFMAAGIPRVRAGIRGTGDSMFPTLSDGDEILVDASDAAGRLRDGIYVLRVDGAIMVKRLAVNPAGHDFTVTSDNPAYPPRTGLALNAVPVIGRGVWMGRRISQVWALPAPAHPPGPRGKGNPDRQTGQHPQPGVPP